MRPGYLIRISMDAKAYRPTRGKYIDEFRKMWHHYDYSGVVDRAHANEHVGGKR
jgi:hypothetical protein